MPQAKHAYTTPKIPLPRAMSRADREKVRVAVEGLLEAVEALTVFLDRADGDPDLEPYLGYLAPNDGLRLLDAEGDEHDGREHSWHETHGGGGSGGGMFSSEDSEPSLAHTNDINQVQAQQHLQGITGRDGTWYLMDGDNEAEHDGREDAQEDTGREDMPLSGRWGAI